MYKRLKVKLYPTHKQKVMLENHFSAYRYCYNLCLEYKKVLWSDYKKNVSGYDMQNELFEIRKEIFWLNNCKAECLRDAALQVDKSYKNFFSGKGFPKFKSKKDFNSFTAYQSINFKARKLKFFGNQIKFKTSEKYNQLLETHKIKQCTFKKDNCGDYWATLLIDTNDAKVLPKTKNEIGVDLGIKHLAITSEGEYFENNRYLQSTYYKLRKLQRRFAKTKKGGKNKEKLRVKIAKLYRKAVRQKEHYYHQITNQLLRENQTIYIEDLCSYCMLEEKKMSREISDASFSLFVQMLEYKANWYNREVIKIDRWFPSSKTCSNCGIVKEELSLSERVYRCSCGNSIDRDLNAALNILKEGQKIKALA